MFGAFSTVWALMQLFSQLLGMVSDRYGRRPVILISCLGHMFMAVVPSLTLLFVGRMISGITSATIGTSFAYIADVTPSGARPRLRPCRHGVRAGLRRRPGDRRAVLGSLDPRLRLWASAAACLINAGFGWFVPLESLPPEKRMAFVRKRANPVESFRLLATHRAPLGMSCLAIMGLMSRLVRPSEQGQLQGANTSLGSVAGLIRRGSLP